MHEQEVEVPQRSDQRYEPLPPPAVKPTSLIAAAAISDAADRALEPLPPPPKPLALKKSGAFVIHAYSSSW
jgi:hypothetical protein